MRVLLFAGLIVATASAENFDPCCSYPCQNFGICNRIGFTDQYYCDCYGTGSHGSNCESPYFKKWLKNTLLPSPQTVNRITTSGKWIWAIINNVKFLHSFFMRKVIELRSFLPTWPEAHNTAADYTTWDGYANKTFYSLTLPPVPKNCPTEMGVAGPKVLPPVSKVVEEVFTRTTFKPCPLGTSVLLPFYGQHFTHQAFKSYLYDRTVQWGDHQMDLAHLYGETRTKQLAMRSLQGGKMKMQIINGEEYPPKLEDCPGMTATQRPVKQKHGQFALGHTFFDLLPSLLYWSTLWLREHNRLCDLLAEKYPNWDDERLFQTARLNVLAQTLSITVGDYAQLVSNTHLDIKYEPELIHDSSMRWASNRIHIEFATMYHWHSMVPDSLQIGGKNYSLKETHFNMDPLLDHGMAVFTESLSKQVAGRGPGGRNVPPMLLHILEKTLKMNRRVRLQPYNRYRQFFRLPPYKTFEELTGEKRLAKVLSDLYGGDIDAVEYFVGMLVEQRYPTTLWGITYVEAIAKYAFRTMFSNAIGSPEYWRESTFGGKDFFELSKTTTLQQLACRNIEGCPKISFTIPKDKVGVDKGMIYDDIINQEDAPPKRNEL